MRLFLSLSPGVPNARHRTEHLSLAGRLRLIHLDATGWLLRIIYEYGSLPWVLHSFSSFWFLADRSRNQLTGAGRARNRVTSRSRRSTKRGCLARCLAHSRDASSNRISARFVRSWQSPLSNFSLDRQCKRAAGYLPPPEIEPSRPPLKLAELIER